MLIAPYLHCPMQMTIQTDQKKDFMHLVIGGKVISAHELNIPNELKDGFDLTLKPTLKNMVSVNGSRCFLVSVFGETADPSSERIQLDSLSSEYVLGSANLLLASGEYLLAQHLYLFLLKQNVEDWISMKNLGISYFHLKDYRRSRKCFSRLGEVFNRSDIWFWNAVCYHREGKNIQARELFEKVLTIDEFTEQEKFIYFKEYGTYLLEQEDWDGAKTFYERAIEVNPVSEEMLIQLGMLLLFLGDDAEGCFKRAIELNVDHPRAHLGLGIQFALKGAFDEAEKSLLKALGLDPLNLTALSEFVRLCSQSGRFAEAKQEISNYIKRRPKESQAYFLLCSIFMREGKWKECLDYLEVILSLDPNHQKAKALRDELIITMQRGRLI